MREYLGDFSVANAMTRLDALRGLLMREYFREYFGDSSVALEAFRTGTLTANDALAEFGRSLGQPSPLPSPLFDGSRRIIACDCGLCAASVRLSSRRAISLGGIPKEGAA
jgi:hypothetical protein